MRTESPEEWEDFRHDMAMQAYCAPDADLDTIRESLAARIADLTRPAVCHAETFHTGTGLAGRCTRPRGHRDEHAAGGRW